MRLVLYLGWPTLLALVVGAAGFRLGLDSVPPSRLMSSKLFGKFEGLSVCVQSVTGERRDAETARGHLTDSLIDLQLPGPRLFTVPANVDVGCPGEPANFSTAGKMRRVADREGGRGLPPSPYHLHVFLLPRATLQMLRLERDLGSRHVVVEEYITEGSDQTAVLTGVTYGLYASIDELRDGQKVRQFFNQAIQMKSQLGAPPRSRS